MNLIRHTGQPFEASIGRRLIIRATDDAMHPTIAKGGMVALEPQKGRFSDGIYLLDIAGRPTLRRVQSLTKGGYRIICDNPLYIGQETAQLPPILAKAVCAVQFQPFGTEA